MGIDVLLEVIDCGLLVVTQIADLEIPLFARAPLQGEHLTEGGGADEGRWHDIMVVFPPSEYLVIRLSVVRTEHDADEWDIQFVAHAELLAEEWKVVCGNARRHQFQTGMHLCGIIGIDQGVDEAEIGICQSASLQM